MDQPTHLQPLVFGGSQTEAAGFAFGAVKEPLMVLPVGNNEEGEPHEKRGFADPRKMLTYTKDNICGRVEVM